MAARVRRTLLRSTLLTRTLLRRTLLSRVLSRKRLSRSCQCSLLRMPMIDACTHSAIVRRVRDKPTLCGGHPKMLAS